MDASEHQSGHVHIGRVIWTRSLAKQASAETEITRSRPLAVDVARCAPYTTPAAFVDGLAPPRIWRGSRGAPALSRRGICVCKCETRFRSYPTARSFDALGTGYRFHGRPVEAARRLPLPESVRLAPPQSRGLVWTGNWWCCQLNFPVVRHGVTALTGHHIDDSRDSDPHSHGASMAESRHRRTAFLMRNACELSSA